LDKNSNKGLEIDLYKEEKNPAIPISLRNSIKKINSIFS